MYRLVNIISLEALTDDSQQDAASADVGSHRLLDNADVVYAVNGRDDRDIVVFGKEKLRRIAESEIPEGARVVRVQLRSGSSELQSLLALVQQSKGHHDYAESA
jgi:hypothetical protein